MDNILCQSCNSKVIYIRKEVPCASHVCNVGLVLLTLAGLLSATLGMSEMLGYSLLKMAAIPISLNSLEIFLLGGLGGLGVGAGLALLIPRIHQALREWYKEMKDRAHIAGMVESL